MKKYLAIIAVIVGTLLTACNGMESAVKYKVSFNSTGFETNKTMYAPGEKVTVRYDYIATDTDYSFYSDDVELKQDFDGGYVFTFIMPDHDVTLHVESRNSMEYDPEAMGDSDS